ncbi:MAG: hypothetical protein INR62_01940 [Rhodospirillales bacterium]|nr:hypothetical protein [Acetobacter sp.]
MASPTLRKREYRALLGALDRLYQPITPGEFPRQLFRIVGSLLPDTVTSFDFVELATGKIESHVTPDAVANRSLPELEAIVRQYAWQNPVVKHLADGHPTAVVQPSDFISQHEFRETDLYQLAFRALEIDHQVAAGLAWSGHAGGLIVNRTDRRDFTAREVELIRRLRPHVEHAFFHCLLIADLRQRLETRAAAPAEQAAVLPEACSLTVRELEVLHWITQGKRDSEIATILGIAPRTVHKHVENLLGKLGVETRTAAAACERAARPPTQRPA